MLEAGVSTTALSKTYTSPRASINAVQDLTLKVATGEFFGLLGPNGAGKSTTIGVLTTLIRPTSGTVEVAGVDVEKHPVSVTQQIGVVSQSDTLDRQLNVGANLEFRGRFFGMSRRVARRRADELLEMFSLVDRREAKTYELSGGQIKRLMIARALMHRPRVLFLDEPTAGIDPQTRYNLWEALKELHQDGMTILLTTHDIHEAEGLCERIAILDGGRLLACDTPANLTAMADAETSVTVTFDSPVPDDLKKVAERADVSRVEIEDNIVRGYSRDAEALLGEMVAAGANAGMRIRDAATLRPSLESAFLNLTGREYRE
jgi:ABC-type multidrug transport system ATPase subunit